MGRKEERADLQSLCMKGLAVLLSERELVAFGFLFTVMLSHQEPHLSCDAEVCHANKDYLFKHRVLS